MSDQFEMLEDYGMATVVEGNKYPSPVIKVFPQNRLPTVSGELKGKDVNLALPKGNVKGSVSTEVIWTGLNSPNRITAPVMFEGEQVRLLRFIGTDTIVWQTIGTDHKLKKQEAVTYGWSCVPEGKKDELNDTNSITLEIDNVQKFVNLRLPDNDNEPTPYNLRFDRSQAVFNLTDELGNSIELRSVKGIWELTSKSKVIVNTVEAIVNASKSVTLNTPDTYAKGNVFVDGNLTVNQKTHLKDNLDCGGAGNFSGNLHAASTPFS